MASSSQSDPADPATGMFPLPLDTAPMEARSEEELPRGGRWRYEPKWDGFRCLAFRQGGDVDLRAKSGKPLGRYFPEVVEFLRTLASNRFVIDGELVVDVDGRPSFDALQMRLHPSESRIRKLSRETPARLVVFDMLAGPDGRSIMAEPFAHRRQDLEQFVEREKNFPGLALSPISAELEQAKQWLSEAGKEGSDGVVAKNLDDPYLSGERTMIKVKRLRTADCVVGGFRYQSKSDRVGSLLLGLYNDEGLLDHVGFTSTITNEERDALTGRLEALKCPPGFTGKAPGGPSRWSTARSAEWQPLRPELVVEVRFDHVTAGRFRHGTKLLRWRPDKSPRQCTYDQIAAAEPSRSTR